MKHCSAPTTVVVSLLAFTLLFLTFKEVLRVVFDGTNNKIYVLSMEKTTISSNGDSSTVFMSKDLSSDPLFVMSFQYNPWPRATTTWVDRMIGSRSVHFNTDLLHSSDAHDVNVSMFLLHHQLPAYARWSSCSIELLAIRHVGDNIHDQRASSIDTSRIYQATLNINNTWKTQCYLRYHPLASQQSQLRSSQQQPQQSQQRPSQQQPQLRPSQEQPQQRPSQQHPQQSQSHVRTSSTRPQSHQNNHNHNHNHDTPFSGSKTTRRSLSHQPPPPPSPQQQSSSPNLSPSTLHPELPSNPQKYRQNQRKSHQCISVFCPAWEQQNCDDYITLIQSQSNISATGNSPPSTSTTDISQPFVFGTLTLVEERVDSHIERDHKEVVKKDLDTEDFTAVQSTGPTQTTQTIQTASFHAYTTQPTQKR